MQVLLKFSQRSGRDGAGSDGGTADLQGEGWSGPQSRRRHIGGYANKYECEFRIIYPSVEASLGSSVSCFAGILLMVGVSFPRSRKRSAVCRRKLMRVHRVRHPRKIIEEPYFRRLWPAPGTLLQTFVGSRAAPYFRRFLWEVEGARESISSGPEDLERTLA